MLQPEKTNRLENNVKKILSVGGTAWGASVADASELLAKLTLDAGADYKEPNQCRPHSRKKLRVRRSGGLQAAVYRAKGSKEQDFGLEAKATFANEVLGQEVKSDPVDPKSPCRP